jgi:hypothetical protein
LIEPPKQTQPQPPTLPPKQTLPPHPPQPQPPKQTQSQTQAQPQAQATTPIITNTPSIAQPIYTPISSGRQVENVPVRLDYRNRYFVLNSDHVVAVWEAGRGWQINVGNGFAPAKKNIDSIPDQGTFAFAELVIGNPELSMTSIGGPTAMHVFRITLRGALTALYRDEGEILRKVESESSLTKPQQTALWQYLSENFTAESIANSRSIIVTDEN